MRSVQFINLLFVLVGNFNGCLFGQFSAPVQNFGIDPRAYVERQSFWTEFNLAGTISKDGRWQYQMDYQYRKASDASFIKGGTSNPFNEIQQQVFRPWIHYWAVPKVVRFSLSPIGFWVTWTPKEEARFFAQADWSPTSYNYPYFTTVDAKFVNANDGDSNLKYVGVTGSVNINVNLTTKVVSVN